MQRMPLVVIRRITEREEPNHHQQNGATSGLSRTICRNIIPYQKMINGGELAIPSGETLREPSLFSLDIISPDSQVNLAFMICAFQKSCDSRSTLPSCMESLRSASTSIGLEGKDS